jgi:hypothetical protein
MLIDVKIFLVLTITQYNSEQWSKGMKEHNRVNVKVKLTLEHATKAQRGSRVIALLFLYLRR